MTTAAQIARINRLLVALSRDVAETEGRDLDYETAEQMQRNINAAQVELDALALNHADDEPAQLAA